MTTIFPIERIEREAKDAAARRVELADACPYPFHSPEGQLFARVFKDAVGAELAKGLPSALPPEALA